MNAGMPSSHDEIRAAIARVRARWRRVRAGEGVFRAATAAAAIAAAGLVAAGWAERRPAALAALGAVTVLVALAAIGWFLWPLRRRPAARRVARFIEERAPDLDDRLVSAVDVLESGRPASGLAEPMLADAARRLDAVDPAAIVPGAALARAAVLAAAATVALLAVLLVGRARVRQAYDAAALTLFPEHVTIEVEPGNARVRVGDPFTISARIAGSRLALVPRVEMAVGPPSPGLRRAGSDIGAEMVAGPPSPGLRRAGETFQYALGRVTAPFTYRVTAPGGLEAGPFTVDAVSPPRVQRIDVEYDYPAALGLAKRTEEDAGDIYAPEGTTVRVRVHTDRPAGSGTLQLAAGQAVRLDPREPTTLEGELRVTRDDSYRVALAGPDGLSSDGDAEYFIRALEDRPPDVRITEPAGDRNVTSLEEVDVTARADDDYGVARMELVYAVGGGAEHVLPMTIPAGRTSATGSQTIYLEDLDVKTGDLVSYYVRARDVARGKRATDARSDIYFLQVRPFEQNFSLAQSQAASSGAGDAIGDLVNAQKDVVSATWKLDRRAEAAGARSGEDVRAVSRAEAALKTRVEQVSAAFGASTMREPKRASPIAPEPLVPIPQRPEAAAMTAASAAMGGAVEALDGLRTTDALPHEMEALDELLKAQAEVKDIQVATGQGSGGRGNSNYDLSSLFDRELQRSQQTNYETPQSGAQPDAADQKTRELLDAIHALAERQDELAKRQRDLANEQMADAERRRQLEQLTREQSALREQAEQLGRQSPQNQGGVKSASDAMQASANELRRANPGAAGRSAGRALDALHDLERRLQGQPGAGQQARGDAQLEARRLADTERRLASELEALTGNQPGGDRGGRAGDQDNADRRRQLAAEQERLADRADKLDDSVPDLQSGGVGDRMRQAAEAVRAGAAEAGGGARGATGGQATDARTADTQRDIARTLERSADRLAQEGAPADEASQRLTQRMNEIGDVREKLDEVSREIAKLGQAAGSDRAGELAELRAEYQRQLERAERALDEARRDAPSTEASVGFTFEGQGMTLSSPGTEAFKQDFARWEELRRQADAALEHAASSLARELGARQSADRLASGLDDRAPSAYQDQVDAYFKAIAERGR